MGRKGSPWAPRPRRLPSPPHRHRRRLFRLPADRGRRPHRRGGHHLLHSDPLVVTGLKPRAASAGDNYRVLEGALSLVNSFTVGQAARYREVLFKVTLPPGVYYLSYYDGAAGTAQCLHLCRNTWLSMNGVTLRKADTVNGAMLRNCLSGSGSSGYRASGNLILEGGTWDVGMAHFDAGSDTDRFSSLRAGTRGRTSSSPASPFWAASAATIWSCAASSGCSVVNCTFRATWTPPTRAAGTSREAIQIDVVNNDAIAPLSYFTTTPYRGTW